MKKITKHDEGVAGLTILLSLVTMLFVIGLLIMLFSLMGGELRDATFDVGSVTVTNESGGYINATGYTLAQLSSYLNPTGITITTIHNASNGVVIASGNYTLSSVGVLTNATVTNLASVNVTYTFNYDAETTATEVMNDTTAGISGVTDWYPIFIVITAMVVLILLTVIIITAIRGSGLMAGSGSA